MEEDSFKDIVWIEDESNIMELSLRTILAHGKGRICLTKNPKDGLDNEPILRSNGKDGICSKISTIVMFAKPYPNGNERFDSIEINSEIKAIPRLLLMGPQEDMKSILNEIECKFSCLKQNVNFSDFLDKVREFPMYWAAMDTTREIKIR